MLPTPPEKLLRDYYILNNAKREVITFERELAFRVQGSQTCQSEGVQTHSQWQGRESPLLLPTR